MSDKNGTKNMEKFIPELSGVIAKEVPETPFPIIESIRGYIEDGRLDCPDDCAGEGYVMDEELAMFINDGSVPLIDIKPTCCAGVDGARRHEFFNRLKENRLAIDALIETAQDHPDPEARRRAVDVLIGTLPNNHEVFYKGFGGR